MRHVPDMYVAADRIRRALRQEGISTESVAFTVTPEEDARLRASVIDSPSRRSGASAEAEYSLYGLRVVVL